MLGRGVESTAPCLLRDGVRFSHWALQLTVYSLQSTAIWRPFNLEFDAMLEYEKAKVAWRVQLSLSKPIRCGHGGK